MTKNSKIGKKLDDFGVELVEIRSMKRTIEQREEVVRNNIMAIMTEQDISEFNGQNSSIKLSPSVQQKLDRKTFIDEYHDLATLIDFVKSGILTVDRKAYEAWLKMQESEMPKGVFNSQPGPVRVLAEVKS